ncbi:MAG: flippase-like domain-containing protein, partial [Candidatus Aminicenantes bacterium]|nr:flippase-like domain-containing protein [Candidatus Aminicenantes bacterium]
HSLFQLNIISQCANIIMPARAGDVLRVYLVSKRHKFTIAHVTGTVVIEKVLDFFVFVLLWVLVPSIFAVSEKMKGYKIALVFAVLTLGLIFLFIWRQEMLLKWGKTFSRILPARMRDRFVDFFDRSMKAFSPLKDRHNLMVMFILTLAFVGGQVLTNYLLFLAFGLRLSVWVALFLLLALQVGNIPPSSPGKVGVFEVAVIYSLSLFAVPRSQALSYGLVLHAVAFLPKILLGLIYLAKMDISLKKKYSIKKDNEIKPK